MSRPLRIEFAGALYHVTSRGNERKNIYLQEDDFELFLATLTDVCSQYNWVIHAYCLISNHYHLLVETPDANLSKGMRQLNGVFTQSMNRKHRRVGHLFQGRYKAVLVDKEAYLLELSRYIVLNPVRAKMVNTPSEWPWSSWHYMVGATLAPNWLNIDSILLLFSAERKQAISEYIQFVQEGVGIDVWDELKHQVFLGSEAFVEKYQSLQLEMLGDLNEVPLKQRTATAFSLEQYKQQAPSRNEAMTIAYQSGCYTLKEIGDYFSLHYSRVSRIVAKDKI